MIGKFIYLTSLIFVVACSSTKNSSSNPFDLATRAINLCTHVYEDKSGKPISSQIDRAYVLVAPDKVDTLFTYGEIGHFDQRDQYYSPYIFCGLLRATPPTVYIMRDYDAPKTIIDPEGSGNKQIGESTYSTSLWYLRFERKNRKFYFSEKRQYSLEEFQKLEIQD